MLTYSSVNEHELKKLIMDEINRLLDILSNGMSLEDYADYKHHIGKITGLRTALELCDEAERIAQSK